MSGGKKKWLGREFFDTVFINSDINRTAKRALEVYQPITQQT